MTANTLNRSQVIAPSSPLPAWSTIAGAVLALVLGIVLARFQADMPWWIAALNATSHVLLLVGIVELGRAGIAGRSRLATAGQWLTVGGLVVWTVAEGVSQINIDVAVAFYATATMAMILGLILLGVAVLRAGRWIGWYRFIPLACGLFMLLVVFPALLFLPDYASNYAIGAWGICWLLLGLALLAESNGRS